MDVQHYFPTVDDVSAAAHGYQVLPDIDDSLHSHYLEHKESLIRQLVEEVMKRAIKKGVSKGLQALTGRFSDIVMKAPAISKTTRHIACLRLLLSNDKYECVCCEGEGQTCQAIVQYIVDQKTAKLARTAAGMVPAIGALQSVGGKLHAAYKYSQGTLGQKRSYMAYDLHCKMSTCALAQAVAAELLGSVYIQHCWMRAFAVRDWGDGWKVLEDKMTSS